MKITDFLSVQTVIPNLTKQDKPGVLDEMAEWLAASYKNLDKKKVLEVLHRSEERRVGKECRL